MSEVAEERGMSVRACLLGSGLVATDLSDPDLEVEAGQELAVIRNILGTLGDQPGLGSQAGTRITMGLLGLLGFAMISSRTARDAIEISDRLGYGKLSPFFLRPWVDEQPDAIHAVFDEHEVPVDVRAFLIERDMALSVSPLPIMFGAKPPVRITTTLDREHGRALAATLSGWSVEIGAERNAVTIDNALLAQPLPNADEHTVHAYEHYVQQLIARRARRTGIAARVRSAMLRQTPVVPTLVDLAAERHVDPRTLRRQLAAAGTSYRALADEVRETLATELLAAGLTLEQVADRLGYCDAATFSRAFKRWTGRTPGSVSGGDIGSSRAAHGRPGPKRRFVSHGVGR
jgi:AraC-like DNA-binding protein